MTLTVAMIIYCWCQMKE